MIAFNTYAEATLSPSALFEELFRVENWNSFKGYGPIPGIDEVEIVERTDLKIGIKFKICNTDGSSHEETIVEYKADKYLIMKMDSFSSPLNRLASHFVEKWDVQAQETRVYVERSFGLYPKNLVGEIALRIISIFLKQAVEIHIEEFGSRVSAYAK